jgi:serine/threonine protein phosphatase PrpC
MAVETIAAVYYDQATSKKVTEDVLPSFHDGTPLQASSDAIGSPLVRLQQAFSTAHWRIHELATLKEEYASMATTCVAAVIKDRQVVIAYVGDSRAYLLRCSPQGSPRVTRLTRDHSMAAQLVRAGALSPEQMHSSPAGDLLLRMLGGSEDGDPLPDFVMHGVQADDHLILCCDGLWGMLTEEQIAQIVCTTPPQQVCAELVRLANEAGGDENISVIVVSFAGEVGQG